MPNQPQSNEFALGVVILGAGASSRMGRPKLLLPWGDTTVVGHLIRQWQSAGAEQIAVVCAAGDGPMDQELDRLGFPVEARIPNPQPDRGMFSSIQCAAQWDGWQPHLTHWAISLGDQPHLRRATLQALVKFGRGYPEAISQPRYQGQARHPVLLPREVIAQLARSRAATFRDFLHEIPTAIAWCSIEDSGLDLDLDRPADYDRAVELFSKDV